MILSKDKGKDEPVVSTTAAAVEAVKTNGEVKALEENGSAGVSEKRVVSNEVASAC